MENLGKLNSVRLLVLCLILLSFTSTGEARGGVGGGGHGSGGCSYWWDCYGWIIILFLSFVGFCVLCCLCMWCRGDCEFGDVECYLCLHSVKKSAWDSGEHRKKCYEENRMEVLNLQKPHNIQCPKCNGTLRLWPQKGDPFICSNQDQKSCAFMNTSDYPEGAVQRRDGKWEIVNDGCNRFNCFSCDFDLCKKCVLRKVNNSSATSDEASAENQGEDDLPTCYLCFNRLYKWEAEDPKLHKKSCLEKNRAEVMSFPMPVRITCSKCGDMLKLWQKKGLPFMCNNMQKKTCISMNSSEWPAGGEPGRDGTWQITNTGSNRFNCFNCDFDLCKECTLRQLRGGPSVADEKQTHEKVFPFPTSSDSKPPLYPTPSEQEALLPRPTQIEPPSVQIVD